MKTNIETRPFRPIPRRNLDILPIGWGLGLAIVEGVVWLVRVTGLGEVNCVMRLKMKPEEKKDDMA